MLNDHVVIDYKEQPPKFKCTKCGEEKTMELPMGVKELLVAKDAFLIDHRDC